jgi:argininosuccinate synthase
VERESYDAFVEVTQRQVSGTVALRLYKGTVTPVSRASRFALYDERFVTFGADDVYQQSDAGGFIRLYGLAERVRALHARERAAAAAIEAVTLESPSVPASNGKGAKKSSAPRRGKAAPRVAEEDAYDPSDTPLAEVAS